MSETERALVVAIEDVATAGVVAAFAAQVVAELNVGAILFLHVRDEHTVLSGIYAMANLAAPGEAQEEAERVLALAEATLRAEIVAQGRAVPPIWHDIVAGDPAAVIARVAAEHHAVGIVLGARRPHALGRLAHPDVRVALAAHTTAPLYLAALQARDADPTA